MPVSGKHNDLEEVGHDTYHHTMFEMLRPGLLGITSREAIEWAWELLTEAHKIDKDRLYVTIFEGAPEEGLARDTEAESEWNGGSPLRGSWMAISMTTLGRWGIQAHVVLAPKSM